MHKIKPPGLSNIKLQNNLQQKVPILYELNETAGTIVLHVPHNLTVVEIFDDLKIFLAKIQFAHIFQLLSFPACTFLIFRLLWAGIKFNSLQDKIWTIDTAPIFEKIFNEIIQEHTNLTPVEFLNNYAKKLGTQLTVKILETQPTNSYTRETQTMPDVNFWTIYLSKLIAAVFGVILLVYIIYNIF